MSAYKINDFMDVPEAHTLIVKYLGGTITPTATLNIKLLKDKNFNYVSGYLSIQPKALKFTYIYNKNATVKNIINPITWSEGDKVYVTCTPYASAVLSIYYIRVAVQRWNENTPKIILNNTMCSRWEPASLSYCFLDADNTTMSAFSFYLPQVTVYRKSGSSEVYGMKGE